MPKMCRLFSPTPPTNTSFIGTTPPTDLAQAYFDDGAAGSSILFAAKVAAAGSGSSVDHEGRGTETSYTMSYSSGIYLPGGATVMVGCGPAYSVTPNANHASYVGATTPTITGAPSPNGIASGAGNVAITITGTNYTPSSKVYIDGVLQNSVYVNATTLTVANAPKKATSGTRAVTVTNGFNGPSSTASTWTFT
jgi:hypothetical protein